MAAGDIILTAGMVVKKVTVKANEDIELGELVVNDGNGFLAATAALAALSNPGVALEAHDYSEATVHTISVLFKGVVEAQKKADTSGYAVYAGNKLTISATAGEAAPFAMTDVTSSVTETTVEAAMLANQACFGTVYEDSASAATTVKVIL